MSSGQLNPSVPNSQGMSNSQWHSQVMSHPPPNPHPQGMPHSGHSQGVPHPQPIPPGPHPQGVIPPVPYSQGVPPSGHSQEGPHPQPIPPVPHPQGAPNNQSQGPTTEQFSEAETLSLIKVWGSTEIKRNFENSKKKHKWIWDKIAPRLYGEMGQGKYPLRTGDDVKNKIENEKKKYNKQVTKMSSGSARPADDKVYDEFEKVLGQSPSSNPGNSSESMDTDGNPVGTQSSTSSLDSGYDSQQSTSSINPTSSSTHSAGINGAGSSSQSSSSQNDNHSIPEVPRNPTPTVQPSVNQNNGTPNPGPVGIQHNGALNPGPAGIQHNGALNPGPAGIQNNGAPNPGPAGNQNNGTPNPGSAANQNVDRNTQPPATPTSSATSNAGRRRRWVDANELETNKRFLAIQEQNLELNKKRQEKEEVMMDSLTKLFNAHTEYYNKKSRKMDNE